MYLDNENRPAITPQLAVRVAILAGIALVMFGIIFFRLWYLQVLSGDKYLAQARVNRVRDVAIPAPRGEIRDRNGALLVDSKPAIAVQIAPPDLPRTIVGKRHLYTRLAKILQVPTKPGKCPVQGVGIRRLPQIPCLVAQQVAKVPYQNVTIKTDVPNDVLYYLSERQSQFPGVQIQQVWLRRYPLHDLAAQLFGTVGPITAQEVKESRYRGVSQQASTGSTAFRSTRWGSSPATYPSASRPRDTPSSSRSTSGCRRRASRRSRRQSPPIRPHPQARSSR
jgi:penicillin-binding protein 2